MNLSDIARLERESGCKPVSDTKQRIDSSLRRHCPNGQLHSGRELLSNERSDGADLHCQLVRVHHYGPLSPTPVSSHIFILAAACDPVPPKSSSNADARNRDEPRPPRAPASSYAAHLRLGTGSRRCDLAPPRARLVREDSIDFLADEEVDVLAAFSATVIVYLGRARRCRDRGFLLFGMRASEQTVD